MSKTLLVWQALVPERTFGSGESELHELLKNGGCFARNGSIERVVSRRSGRRRGDLGRGKAWVVYCVGV
jgi:hypothetical protein